MNDESKMYELEYPAPPMNYDSSQGPVLIVALQGYADAGLAVESAASHLKDALGSRPVVSFNNDEFVDYRSRRPAVTMQHHVISDVEDISLDIRVIRDNVDKPFMLLSGPEPDMRWQTFSKAVADLVERYKISKTICLYAAPMTVPHTRQLVVSAHGNDPELVPNMVTFDSRMTFPGSAALFLERELHERGLNVAGYVAHVPHYIASSYYPEATFQLLRAVQDSTSLKFPLGALKLDMKKTKEQLADYETGNPEIAQVVASLEEQYDQEVEYYMSKHPDTLMPGERSLPTGDELGAEFERFLASIDHQDDEPGAPGDSDDSLDDE